MVSARFFFNPQHMKGKTEAEIVTVIPYEVEKLIHFNYTHFTPAFICLLMNEFPRLGD